MAKEVKFKFHFILMNINFNGRTWPVATLDSMDLDDFTWSHGLKYHPQPLAPESVWPPRSLP